MKKLLTLLIGLLLGTGLTVYAATATFRVVETPIYHLYTGESGSATSMRITPYPTDLDGVKLTYSDFGTNPSVTVDPGLKNLEEIELFTGITDNGDGTATLTGLSRDLQSKYPYTGTGTGRTHGSGATVVFGNNPQVYGRLAAPENTQTWTAIQTFSSTTPPTYDNYGPNFGNFPTTTLADVAYVNNTFNNGQTGFFNVNGINIYNNNAGNVGVGTSSPFGKLSITGNLQQYGLYSHFGNVAPNNSGCSNATATCVEIWGTDNTVGGGGVEFGIGNTSSGVNAYSGMFFNNNLASDNLTDHYGFIGYTGSNYTDTTFGGAQASSSLLFVQNTDGGIAFFPKTGVYFYGTTATSSLLAMFAPSGVNFTATTSLLALNVYGTATSTLTGNLQILKNATTTNLTVSGICSNCATNGYEQITNTGSAATSLNSSVTVTATCSTGKKVLSGGISGIPATASNFATAQILTINGPSGTNAWTASVQCAGSGGSCTSGTITVYAICVNS